MKASFFGRNPRTRRKPIFNLQDIRININKTLSYLGLILDYKFKWQRMRNLQYWISYCVSKYLIFFNPGNNPDILKISYKIEFFKPIWYDDEVWFLDLNYSGIRILKSIQWTALLSIIKVYRNFSTDVNKYIADNR